MASYVSNGVSVDSGHTKRPAWLCVCGKAKTKRGGMFPPKCESCSSSPGLKVVSPGK